jgi:hypothetical protein
VAGGEVNQRSRPFPQARIADSRRKAQADGHRTYETGLRRSARGGKLPVREARASEREWNECLALAQAVRTQPSGLVASQIVKEFFSSPGGLGLVRLRESPYYSTGFQIDAFVGILQELFA